MKKVIISMLAIAAITLVVIGINYHQNTGYADNATYLSSETSIEDNAYVETPDKPLETYDIVIPDRFDKMLDNGDLELYFEPETLAIAVKVMDNGYVYSSYNFYDSFAGKSTGVVNPIKSGVTLNLFKETTPVSISYLDGPQVLGSSNLPAATATYTTEGHNMVIHVDYDHPEIMIKFDIHITLDGKTLSYRVPFDSIDEYNPNNNDNTKQYYLLRNIVLFPYFGSIKSADDGYIVIPDGSGAIVQLDADPQYKTTFVASVYGSDAGYETLNFLDRAPSVKENQRLTLPIYGFIHDVGNTGFLAYIDEGASYADLNFKSTGVINDYYYTYFSYRYRRTFEQYQSRSNEDQYRISFSPEKHVYDLQQSFVFMSGSEANYVGIAKKYQEILIEHGDLQTQARTLYEKTPLSVNMIGNDVTTGIIQNKALKVTTYQGVQQLTGQLIDDGYEALIVRLMTYNMKEDQYTFARTGTMGSKGDLERLVTYLSEQQVDFSYYSDYVRYYGSNMRYLAQTLSRRALFYRQISYMSYAHAVVRPSLYPDFIENDMDDFIKYGITSVSLDSLYKAVFTGYDDGMVYRSQNISDIQQALELLLDNQMRADIYKPNDYLFKYLSSYLDAPLNSSNYKFTSATIPLIQLVLAGYTDMFSPYLNFVSDTENTLLRMVEYGVFPSAILTEQSAYVLKESNISDMYITDYGVLKARLSSFYDFMSPGLDLTIGQTMINHQFIAEGVSKVTYQNGLEIVINYNDTDFVYETTIISPSSYEVIV